MPTEVYFLTTLEDLYEYLLNTDYEDYAFKWKIGEKMALVGRNGCGKSTLVKLLCRLYDPPESTALISASTIIRIIWHSFPWCFRIPICFRSPSHETLLQKEGVY